MYLCSICGKEYGQPQEVTRHYRAVHESNVCFYCDFQWGRRYEYTNHLKEHHPDVNPDIALGQTVYIRKLCMYCDVEWNHSYEYKDHLREHHPNLDPDAVLGEAPWSQCRDKIIARFSNRHVPARKTTSHYPSYLPKP